MRRHLGLVSGFAALCALALAVAAAVLAMSARAGASAAPERIKSYDVDITIQRDDSILVEEQIVYDFGASQRHGIVRDIPVRSRYNSRYDRIESVDVQQVSSPDAPHQYQVADNGSSVQIKIGDPGQLITGQHTYRIRYLVHDSLTAFADHDELYWNATGAQWDVPIDQVTVRVSAPAAPTRAACYAGPPGSTSKCQRAGIADGAASFAQAGLPPHEAFTIVVAIPKGAVATPHLVLQERWSLQRAFTATPATLGASGGLLALLAAGGLVLVRRRQAAMSASSGGGAAQPPAGPASASREPAMQPVPPEGVPPGLAGALADRGVVRRRHVTATIVDLAARGYLRIEDAPRGKRHPQPDWRLVRLGKAGGLLEHEQIVLDGLFKNAKPRRDETSVLLSKSGGADAVLEQARDAMYREMTARGWYTARPDRVRRHWGIISVAVFCISLGAEIAAIIVTDLALVPLPLVLAALVLIAMVRKMPVRTAAGNDLASQARGFRSYLQTTAVQQACSAGQPGLLYDYMPYAIAFGCTGQWDTMSAALPEDAGPAWYQSHLGPSALTTSFIPAIHHFAAAATSSGPAGGSGSAGGSGFSGGAAGGGGGGGGGGSW
jgi:uncharacterized membrane protein YgcG